MNFPNYRPRRTRSSANMRAMVRETNFSAKDLIYPLFVVPGTGIKKEISSLPGNYHWSVDMLHEVMDEVRDLGIPAVLLFGIPSYKDEQGSAAWNMDEPVQRATAEIKKKYPQITVITDVCLCEYTSHGHCGLVDEHFHVDNDSSLPLHAKAALSHARAGADVVAPSGMMDGAVRAIREALDGDGLTNVAIMAYSAKFASSFYGPFRDAAGSAPSCGDRSGYQMDPANAEEALRETSLDIEEGADIIMVKPALAFLDVVRRHAETFNMPLCVYNVSGEFAMVKAAAERGWIDEQRVVMEEMTAFRRAGAKMIITYHALDVARWLRDGWTPR